MNESKIILDKLIYNSSILILKSLQSLKGLSAVYLRYNLTLIDELSLFVKRVCFAFLVFQKNNNN